MLVTFQFARTPLTTEIVPGAIAVQVDGLPPVTRRTRHPGLRPWWCPWRARDRSCHSTCQRGERAALNRADEQRAGARLARAPEPRRAGPLEEIEWRETLGATRGSVVVAINCRRPPDLGPESTCPAVHGA